MATESSVNGQNNGKLQFACLYTKHKTQKRRVWHDGRLLVRQRSAIVFEANPPPGSADPPLDECTLTDNKRQAIIQNKEMRLESDKFLIDVDGPWRKPLSDANKTIAPKVSSSMQKLFNKKFQKPRAYIPPNPADQPNRLQTIMGKRKRPLQPGELVRLHYGEGATALHRAPVPPAFDQRRGPNAYHRAIRRSNNGSSVHQPSNLTNLPQPTLEESRNVRVETATPTFHPALEQQHSNPPQNMQGATDSLVVESDSNDKDRSENGQNHNLRESVAPLLDFASNEFDESRFFGLDDEEEDQENQGTPSTTHQPAPFTLGGIGAESESMERPSEFSVEDNPDPFVPVGIDRLPQEQYNQAPRNPLEQNSNAKNPISGNALLALFGAAPDSQKTPTGPKEATATNSRKDETNESSFQFVLPSQSSSDEDSSDEDS